VCSSDLKKIIRLTESDLARIVKRVINEQYNDNWKNSVSQLVDNINSKLPQGCPKFLFEQIAIFLFLLITILYSLTEQSNTELIATLALFVIIIIRIVPSLKRILFNSQYINYGLASVSLIKHELKENEDNQYINPENNYAKILKSDLNFNTASK
jgi:hypothetical protein